MCGMTPTAAVRPLAHCLYTHKKMTMNLQRKLLLALALLLCATLLNAQNRRHEILLSIGGEPYELETVPYFSGSGTDLYSCYEAREWAYCDSPAVFLDYTYSVRPWLKLGAGLGYAEYYREKWYPTASYGEPVSGLENHFYLLPQIKLFPLNLTHFKIYGKLAGGLGFSTGSYAGSHFTPVFEIVPFGMQWGGQFCFGWAELVSGNTILGGRIGIGFRF